MSNIWFKDDKKEAMYWRIWLQDMSLMASVALYGVMLVILSGCTLTVPPAVVDAVQDALTNRPPAVITPAQTNAATGQGEALRVPYNGQRVYLLWACIDATGAYADPEGYTEASVAANAHYEECNIEPSTGLMIRVPVWRAKSGGWWMLSSLIQGHVRLEKGELVCETFKRNGQTVKCIGATDYEIHQNETPDNVRYTVKAKQETT